MKRIFILLLFPAALTAAAPERDSTAEQPAPKSATKGTKVGIVNLLAVYHKYDKVRLLKEKIEEKIAPFKEKAESLKQTLKEWKAILEDPEGKLKEQNIDRGKQIVIDCERQLQDLDREFKSKVSRRLEKEMSELTKEINDKICEYGKRQGFQLVLGYGKPEIPLKPLENARQTIQSIDAGHIMLVVALGGVDLTSEVSQFLDNGSTAEKPAGKDEPRPQTSSPAQPAVASKVGVVNLGILYTNFGPVKMFKQELETDIKPYKKKKSELDGLIEKWKSALDNPDPKALTRGQRQQGRKIIVDCSRRLEDLEMEYKEAIGKKLEEEMLQMRKNIQEGIRRHGAVHGYDLILAYGEPEVALPPLLQFQRQMKVVDVGGLIHLYSEPGVDVSLDVLSTLNSRPQLAPPEEEDED